VLRCLILQHRYSIATVWEFHPKAAGHRAGVPTIIIPFFGDHPFWGARVAEFGVGPKPIPRKYLTPENLSQAIQMTVTDDAMRQLASNLSSRIRSEDGVASAVKII
jgi:sterol 3beta-glucosyltransferase